MEKLSYRPFTDEDLPVVEQWFDDTGTKKYLGNGEWPRRLLKIAKIVPGTEFKNKKVKSRQPLLTIMEEKPIALIDLETYNDGTASLALVVAPEMRGKGISTRIHKDIWGIPEMTGINKIIGGIEPANVAMISSLKKAGAKISKEINAEGYIVTEQNRPAGERE